MKYTVALVLVAISMVHGSVLGGINTLVGPASLRGPSSGATIVGPDGSVISSATGGALLATSGLGGVVSAAPGVVLGADARLVAAPGAWAAPGVWGGQEVWGAQQAWAAPGVALGRLGSVIQGPSGIVATNGNPWGVQSVGSLGLRLGLENGVWRR